MILTQMKISNFKQFVGDHEIDVPSVATVGVIGANGVGKTTLFEAIEWCLYNVASTSTAKDLHPRGIGGRTAVSITLENPTTSQMFIVERELRKGSSSGSVYRVEPDGEETIVVQGTRQVTDYVSSNLLGLDHKAFAATFFTRQKELDFFGSKVTDRRREVGKLLGLETIRQAQQLIAEDRKSAGNEAKAYRNLYEEQSSGRDFAAEVTTADETIAASTKQLTESDGEVTAAQAKTKGAEETLTAIQQQKDADSALQQAITQLQGERSAAAERLRAAENGLATLADREKERAEIAPVAERVPALQEERKRFDTIRERAVQKRELESKLTANVQRREETIASVARTVRAYPAPANLSGWSWTDADAKDVPSAIARLTGSLGEIDVTGTEQREQGIREAIQFQAALTESTRDLEKYERRLADLKREIESLTADGDPTERITAIDRRRQELAGSTAAALADIRRISTERDDSAARRQRLSHQHVGEACPTCNRLLTAEDSKYMISLLDAEINSKEESIAKANSVTAANRKEQDALDAELATHRKRIADLQDRRARLMSGEEKTAEKRESVQNLGERLDGVLQRLGVQQAPTQDDLTRVSGELQAWRRLLDQRSNLEHDGSILSRLSEDRAPLESELATLTDVQYDEKAHRQVIERFEHALKAQTRVADIDRELARRPQLETSQKESTGQIADLDGQITTKQKERAELAFDPAALQTAQTNAASAREDERVAVEVRHRVQANLREAEHAKKALAKEQDRIADLAKQADARDRDYATYDKMYREFTEFERYAAAWYAPKLSEITSDLVAEVTDGKYSRVEFDNNFSIEIYDGEEEKFPWETFSGGERDAIALCARIAMSRLIGGTGKQPPAFLVLDEVFGSLDLDRRTRLLDMLGSITQAGDSFRQVFIISHVDDVRTSPIFDELWQIVENEAGTSELQSLAHGTDIGEL